MMSMVRTLARVLAVLLGLLVLLAVWRSHRPARYSTPDARRALVVPHLQHLEARAYDGGAHDMQALFPEGHLFTHAITALAWIDLARATGDATFREEAGRLAMAHGEILDAPEGIATFPPAGGLPHGVFHEAWTLQVLTGAVELLGTETGPLRQRCERLGAVVDASDTPWLDAYPGQAWPVDTVVAVGALVRCDEVLGTDHAALIARWVARARAAGPGGVMLHRADEGPRATSLSIALRFMPSIDAEWAAVNHRWFVENHLTSRLGLPAVQEYPDGRGGWGDVDSGPLPWGISLSSTVVGAGVLRAWGHLDLADDILGIGEALAVPLPSRHGRTWALGQLPVGEAFVAWSLAAPPGVDDPLPGSWRWLWEVLGGMLAAGFVGGVFALTRGRWPRS